MVESKIGRKSCVQEITPLGGVWSHFVALIKAVVLRVVGKVVVCLKHRQTSFGSLCSDMYYISNSGFALCLRGTGARVVPYIQATQVRSPHCFLYQQMIKKTKIFYYFWNIMLQSTVIKMK